MLSLKYLCPWSVHNDIVTYIGGSCEADCNRAWETRLRRLWARIVQAGGVSMSVESVLSRVKVHCGEEPKEMSRMNYSSCESATNHYQLVECRALRFLDSWRDMWAKHRISRTWWVQLDFSVYDPRVWPFPHTHNDSVRPNHAARWDKTFHRCSWDGKVNMALPNRNVPVGPWQCQLCHRLLEISRFSSTGFRMAHKKSQAKTYPYL